LNPVHTFTSSFFEINFNIIFDIITLNSMTEARCRRSTNFSSCPLTYLTRYL
jgi:hypothetical protein